MQFIVGYQMRQDDRFADEIIRSAARLKELYFSWGAFASGRRAQTSDEDGTLFEKQQKQAADLARFADAGIKMNLLFNANCYGADSQSRAFFGEIGNTVDFVRAHFGLSSVTTSSPLIAKFIRENFTGLDVRASVNMEIGTVEALSYLKDRFDSFYIKREVNRDLARLKALRDWCDAAGKQMYLLANSGCLNYCATHTFHDNLVAHEAEIAKRDNGYDFHGMCWEFLAAPEGRAAWLARTNFIRPEETGLYEAFTPALKLATRVNRAPARVLRAYLDGRYRGAVTELLEPDHSGAFYPQYVENAAFPADFAARVGACDKNCAACGYCADVQCRATVTLGASPTLKI